MRILALTVGLSAIVLLVAGAGGAPELPVPRHDTLQDYENVCSEANGFTTFSMQISCIKSLVNESTDKFVNNTDPDTQLYLLTAEKLAADIRTKRTTVATARVNLQRALIEVESKHRSEIEAIQARAESDRRERMAANERAHEAQRAHELEEQNAAYQRQQMELMNIQADQQRAAQQQAERQRRIDAAAASLHHSLQSIADSEAAMAKSHGDTADWLACHPISGPVCDRAVQ